MVPMGLFSKFYIIFSEDYVFVIFLLLTQVFLIAEKNLPLKKCLQIWKPWWQEKDMN